MPTSEQVVRALKELRPGPVVLVLENGRKVRGEWTVDERIVDSKSGEPLELTGISDVLIERKTEGPE